MFVIKSMQERSVSKNLWNVSFNLVRDVTTEVASAVCSKYTAHACFEVSMSYLQATDYNCVM